MRRIHMVFLFLLAVGLVTASLVMYICYPVSEHDEREIAAGMIQFYFQPHPHGIWNEDLPTSLTERDRRHYRFEPACDVHPNYMGLEYYYRRFGIEYQQDFDIVLGRPGDPNAPIWTLTPVKVFWNPWKSEWFYLKGQPITITNRP